MVGGWKAAAVVVATAAAAAVVFLGVGIPGRGASSAEGQEAVYACSTMHRCIGRLHLESNSTNSYI